MRRGDSKAMAWCGLVDGRIVEVRWIVDKNGRPQQYQEMLQQCV